MKKFLLSATVIGTFGYYAVHTKVGAEETPVVAVVPSASTLSTPETVVNTPIASLGPTPVPADTPRGMMNGSGMGMMGRYKDGTYTGSVADAFYGNIQVKAVISGGRIADVIFLQYPNDRSTSIEINSQAMPILRQEAIQAQSAKVDGVSGATDSSMAFIQSLGSALQQAQ